MKLLNFLQVLCVEFLTELLGVSLLAEPLLLFFCEFRARWLLLIGRDAFLLKCLGKIRSALLLHNLIIQSLELLDISAIDNTLKQVLSVILNRLLLTVGFVTFCGLFIKRLCLGSLVFGGSFGTRLLAFRGIHLFKWFKKNINEMVNLIDFGFTVSYQFSPIYLGVKRSGFWGFGGSIQECDKEYESTSLFT